MRAQCCICQEHLEDENIISALECGHIFHTECVGKWLDTGSSCPSCRMPVNRKRIVQLFIDGGDVDLEDAGVMQNELDKLRLSVHQAKSENAELKSQQESLRERIKRISSEKSSLEKEIMTEKTNFNLLRKQLEMFHREEKAVAAERIEYKKIKKKLILLQSMETLLEGCESEAENIIATAKDGGESAVQHLSRQCALLKREFEKVKAEKKTLKSQLNALQKESIYKKQAAEDSKKEAAFLSEQFKRSEEDLKNAEKEISALKKKLSKLKHVIQSPGNAAASSSFMETLMEASPAGTSSPAVQLQAKTSARSRRDKVDLNVTPDLFDSPENVKKKRSPPEDTSEVQVRPFKISTAAEHVSHPAKKFKRDIQTLSTMNIFKKKGPTDMTSITRKGFDGLGGHATFVNSSKAPAAFKKPGARKPLSKLGNSKSLPKLDSFIMID